MNGDEKRLTRRTLTHMGDEVDGFPNECVDNLLWWSFGGEKRTQRTK